MAKLIAFLELFLSFLLFLIFFDLYLYVPSFARRFSSYVFLFFLFCLSFFFIAWGVLCESESGMEWDGKEAMAGLMSLMILQSWKVNRGVYINVSNF